MTEYFNNRKEGPKPNHTKGEDSEAAEDSELAWAASKGRSRTVCALL